MLEFMVDIHVHVHVHVHTQNEKQLHVHVHVDQPYNVHVHYTMYITSAVVTNPNHVNLIWSGISFHCKKDVK